MTNQITLSKPKIEGKIIFDRFDDKYFQYLPKKINNKITDKENKLQCYFTCS